MLRTLFLHQSMTFLSPGATDESLTYDSHLANCRRSFMSGAQKGIKFEKAFKLPTYGRMESSLPKKFSKNVARTLGLQMKHFHNPLVIC